MAYQYNKLKGRIVEICGTTEEFSRRMGFSKRTASLKLNNKSPWRQQDIMTALAVLGLSKADIQDYFFNTI